MPLGTRRLGVSFLFLVKLCFSGIILSPLCASEDASEQGALVTETQFSDSEILYVKHIQSILLEKCLGCHGVEGRDIEGGLDVRSLQSLMSGGDSGEPAIVIGKPQSSPIYLAASRESVNWSAMPPKDAERLGSEELELLARWIATGAHWPTAERVKKIESTYQEAWSSEEGVKFPTSGGLTDEWTNRKYLKEDLWAYQSIATIADATTSEPQTSVHSAPTRKDGSLSEI
ncbi:MAG: c-type cytochrome domain-containing protein, partial [Planctomycetota bacterium]|nr:c-type cytochrome domain-containing protein [Planctomycetota bacterium]